MTARQLRCVYVIAAYHNSENSARTKNNRATESVVGQSANRNVDVPYHAIATDAVNIVACNSKDGWKSFSTAGGADSKFCRRLIVWFQWSYVRLPCPTMEEEDDHDYKESK